MRLTIDHRTTYRFAEPQARIVQLLRMTPGNSDDQVVAAWHLSVDCNAQTSTHRDGFGNVTTMLYCDGPIDSLEISVTGEVVTSRSGGVVKGGSEPLPPRLFLRTTPATEADEKIREFARGCAAGDEFAQLCALNDALKARFDPVWSRPEPGLTAAQAFERASATPRDLAQIFVAAGRSIGIPARFVSGYCDLARDRNPTPHAWAEAWLPDTGWLAFDPTLALRPEDHHVRVAVALDAAGAAPVAGSRLGEGAEVLDVAVIVRAD